MKRFDDLLGYCRYSANPVGHLVLYLCGYRDPERQALSDSTCTALQLANFWQDVSDDYSKGRIYLPLEDLRRYGDRGGHFRRSQHAGVLRDDALRGGTRAPVVSARLAAGGTGGSRTRHRHRTVQPRRTGNSERHRTPGICRVGPAPGHLQDPQTGAGGSSRAGEVAGGTAGGRG